MAGNNKGRKLNLSPEDRARRSEQMKTLNAKREEPADAPPADEPAPVDAPEDDDIGELMELDENEW